MGDPILIEYCITSIEQGKEFILVNEIYVKAISDLCM
jgi:hypothetical protein